MPALPHQLLSYNHSKNLKTFSSSPLNKYHQSSHYPLIFQFFFFLRENNLNVPYVNNINIYNDVCHLQAILPP